MDSQLRELERKANTGDYEAANQLHRLRVRTGAEDVANLSAIWMKYWIQNKDLPEDASTYVYTAPGYARYGYVTGPLPKYSEDIEPEQTSQRWRWITDPMTAMGPDEGRAIQGYATSFEGAKRIVEVVLQETATCLPKERKKK